LFVVSFGCYNLGLFGSPLVEPGVMAGNQTECISDSGSAQVSRHIPKGCFEIWVFGFLAGSLFGWSGDNTKTNPSSTGLVSLDGGADALGGAIVVASAAATTPSLGLGSRFLRGSVVITKSSTRCSR
jgi:hypothetical protein